MNCDSIKQNCSSKLHHFQYHCVINEDRTNLVEVCALNRTIFGFCSEYNTMGKVIQEHYSENCTKHDQPCPIFYNSAESYKYQECYQLRKESKRNSETQHILLSSSNRLCGQFVLTFLCIFSITYKEFL